MRKISRMPATIENVPNVVNDEHHAVADLVGRLERVLLGRLDLEARRRRGWAQRVIDGVCVAHAATVCDEDVVDLSRLADELLGRRRAGSSTAAPRVPVPS